MSASSSCGSGMQEDGADSPTKHNLTNDAEWKLIQKNTFTRWINERLKLANKQIGDIETDLSDGLNLITLLEILSGKKFQKYTKKPIVRTQKLENVTMALKFLQVSEKIKIVNIDSSDIVDHNTKLILGLVWMLILHYSIAVPNYDLSDLEEEEPKKIQRKGELSPKQRLLQWIKSKVVDLNIKNFTSDWNDGRAIGALVEGVAPGLCPDWDTWKTSDSIRNSREAMTLAEDWLDVPQLIKPEEMCNPKVDEMSVMTYLSQFPNAQLKPGAPLKPQIRRSRIRIFGLKNNGLKVNEEMEFTVETFHAGEGELKVELVEPNSNVKQVETVFNNDKYLTYTSTFTPRQEGPHLVRIFYAGREIPKSPYSVEVSGFVEREVKVVAGGRGLQKTGNTSNEETSFVVLAKNANYGDIDVIVTDPNGNRDSIRPTISKISDDEWLVSYTPTTEGVHSVEVNCLGRPVTNAPFSVAVASNMDPSKWCVGGRGMQRTGIRVGDRATLKVTSPDVVVGSDLKVEMTDGSGNKQMVNSCKISDTEYEYDYLPTTPGTYDISTTYKNKHVGKSPYVVEVKERSKCSVKAFGPGLRGGIVGRPASFCLETNGDNGSLAFSIEGPSKAEIDCLDNEDGSALITYHPTHPGEYAVHILCNDDDIRDSPFISVVTEPSTPSFDPSEVKVSGPLTRGDNLIVGVPSRFEVDVRGAGGADDDLLEISLNNAKGNPVGICKLDHKNGVCGYEITPEQSVRHCLLVSYGGLMVPGSPFKFSVSEPSDPSKVRLQGPALDGNVVANETTHLLVDCSKAGPGDVAIMLSDREGMDVPMETEEFGVSSFKVIFRPSRSGRVEGKVFFADREIPGSPFYIEVKPKVDVSKVQLVGLEKEIFVETPTEFLIDARDLNEVVHMKANLTTPSGRMENIPIEDNRDGTYKATVTLHEEGAHKLVVLCNDSSIGDVPRVVLGKVGSDPSKVKVRGAVTKPGLTNHVQKFEVQTKGAGLGRLNVSVSGPSEVRVTCRDGGDGTSTVEYLPTARGSYEVSVLYGEHHVPGSPFKVEIKDDIDPSKIKFDDLERIVAKKGHGSKFKIDTKLAGQSDLKIISIDPQGARRELPIIVDDDGLHCIQFHPFQEGLYSIEVWFGGEKVKTSKVQVHPSFDASKVVLSGDGASEKVFATVETDLLVDASKAGEADLVVRMEDHMGRPLKHEISKEGNSTYRIKYRPDDVGHCIARIFYGGDEVRGSPLRVAVVPSGDASKVKILGGNDSKVATGSDVRIRLNHLEAGVGKIKSVVENESSENVSVRTFETIEGNSEVVYKPNRPGVYDVKIYFGGTEIPDGSFQQEALSKTDFDRWEEEMKSKSSTFLSNGPDAVDGMSFRQFFFNVPMGPVFGFLQAEVTTPSGAIEAPEVINNLDGSITLKYLPNQAGPHLLDVTCNGSPVEGYSPFQFEVDGFNSAGKVRATGPGLTTGISNSTCSFNVAFNDSDLSGMAISIEGPSKVIIDLEDAGNDSVNVYYKPVVAGDYVISILHSHQHVEGSPFVAKILPLFKDLTLAQMSIGSKHVEPLNLGIDASAADLSKMTCRVVTPMGTNHMARLKMVDGKKLGVMFDAKEPGDYSFDIFKSGVPVPGSPFKKCIPRSQCSDADSVKVYGPGLVRPRTSFSNEFFVDYKNAGIGGLNLNIDGPSKVELECVEEKEGVCKINFTPNMAGTYVLTILFSSEHVLGSPFLLEVTGDDETKSEPSQLESLIQSYSAISDVGRESLLNLMIPASMKDGLRVFVSGPSGFLDSCYFVPSSSSSKHYSVGFVPKETGLHLVHVNDGKDPLPGSPFTFVVGPLFATAGGQNLLRVSGNGLNGGYLGIPGLVTIDSRQAGEGNLSITMEGTMKPAINFQDRHDGTCDVTYTCGKPGDYLLTIKFNGKHVKGSPFAILIKGFETTNAEPVNKKIFNPEEPAYLELPGSGTKGRLEAIVRSPSGLSILPIIQERNTEGHIIRFIPREKGLHSVEVSSDGTPIGDSPYKIFVGEMLPDPTKVTCSGPGLGYGRSGEASEFQVSTDGCGFGSLEVSVDGPSRVNLVCGNPRQRPLKFSYVPTSPGLYKINVCFAGSVVPYSPFVVEVTGPGKPLPWNEVSNFKVNISSDEHQSLINHQPMINHQPTSERAIQSDDSTSVICSGDGLKYASVNQSNVFCVDASATTSHRMLTADIQGPSGPCSDVSITTLAPKKYLVTYRPQETGPHALFVQWGEAQVSGSPFHVPVM